MAKGHILSVSTECINRKGQRYLLALSTAQCDDYGLVKERILQAYELVPEAYHQKFRNLVKQGGQTYVEFAREKENVIHRWLSSIKVDDYDNLNSWF